MRAHRTRVGATLRLAAAGLALAAGACRTATPVAGTADRPTFVLVHGAFQDASAWARVGPLLEARGHRVMAVDLPAHGRDTTPPGRATLAGYRDAVVAVIDRQPGPVVLVGHSFGGVVISAVAEAVPEKVRTLAYVAAYLPADGESLVALSQRDTANSFTQQNFVVAADL